MKSFDLFNDSRTLSSFVCLGRARTNPRCPLIGSSTVVVGTKSQWLLYFRLGTDCVECVPGDHGISRSTYNSLAR